MSDTILRKRISDLETGYTFKVKDTNECPVYHLNDRFELHDSFLFTPAGKPTCLPLTSDMILNKAALSSDNSEPLRFSCEGCGGSKQITLEHVPENEITQKEEQLANLLQKFSFFKLLRIDDIKELIPELTIENYNTGDTIIRKGDIGQALYVIIEGTVEVLPEENSGSIVEHGTGKVFGEMSLLSGDLCTATVRAIEPIQVLKMKPERFRSMIHTFPKLQQYFFQLLARRLDETNVLRVRSDAEIMGNLTEWKLPDLLQTLNINNKCGTLTFNSKALPCSVTFYNGQISQVEYDSLTGIEAFYSLFTMKDDSFSFRSQPAEEIAHKEPLADFMFLMVEGLVRWDEQNRND